MKSGNIEKYDKHLNKDEYKYCRIDEIINVNSYRLFQRNQMLKLNDNLLEITNKKSLLESNQILFFYKTEKTDNYVRLSGRNSRKLQTNIQIIQFYFLTKYEKDLITFNIIKFRGFNDLTLTYEKNIEILLIRQLPIQINNWNQTQIEQHSILANHQEHDNEKKNKFFKSKVFCKKNFLPVNQYKMKKFSFQLSNLSTDKPLPFGLAYKSKLFKNLPKLSIYTKELDLKINIDEVKKHYLRTHNKYRQLHNSSPLIYSHELEKTAELWANVLAKTGVLAYSQENNFYTENLTEIKDISKINGVIDLWYLQSKNYDFDHLNHYGNIDKFCTMIWKSSVNVGFGIAASHDKRIFIVAHYNPPSLQIDKFKENVQPKRILKSRITSELNMLRDASPKLVKRISKEDLKSFEEITLKEINNLRFYHLSPNLKLNTFLCKIATEHANFCAANDRLLSVNETMIGVTYLELTLKDISITNVLLPRLWYAESLNYNYKEEPRTPQYNNFTQLIWKNSKDLGIGIATSLGGITYVIGIFRPAGNIPKHYVENIYSPKKYNKFCSCKCGYSMPSCIKDLKLTILSKFPDKFITKSKFYIKHIPRTYCVVVKNAIFLKDFNENLLDQITNVQSKRIKTFKSSLSNIKINKIAPEMSIMDNWKNYIRDKTDKVVHPLYTFLPIKNENIQNDFMKNIKCIQNFSVNDDKGKFKKSKLKENCMNKLNKQKFFPKKKLRKKIQDSSDDSSETMFNITNSIFKSSSY